MLRISSGLGRKGRDTRFLVTKENQIQIGAMCFALGRGRDSSVSISLPHCVFKVTCSVNVTNEKLGDELVLSSMKNRKKKLSKDSALMMVERRDAFSLGNAVKASSLTAPNYWSKGDFIVSKQKLMEIRGVTKDFTPDKCSSLKSASAWKYKKGDIPDSVAPTGGLIKHWNSGGELFWNNGNKVVKSKPKKSRCYVQITYCEQCGVCFHLRGNKCWGRLWCVI